MPMLLGHESAGVIEELGEGVDDVKVRQHVTLAFRVAELVQPAGPTANYRASLEVRPILPARCSVVASDCTGMTRQSAIILAFLDSPPVPL